jgi:hypothetical protein
MEPKTLEDKAIQWMLDHPEAMKLYEEMALKAASRSRKFGIGFLTERIRWEFRIVRDDPGFKINNNHRAYIARELIRMHPSLEGKIELRHVKEEN